MVEGRAITKVLSDRREVHSVLPGDPIDSEGLHNRDLTRGECVVVSLLAAVNLRGISRFATVSFPPSDASPTSQ